MLSECTNTPNQLGLKAVTFPKISQNKGKEKKLEL